MKTFEPILITDPVDCIDTFWMYQANLPADFPTNIEVTFRSDSNEIQVSQAGGATNGYVDASRSSVEEHYEIQVNGFLGKDFEDSDGTLKKKKFAFNLKLIVDCCSEPTIIMAP